MNPRHLIGLSAGACAEGVDAVLLEATGAGFELRPRCVQTVHQPFGRDLRQLLRQQMVPEQADARQVAVLHRVLGEAFAAAARQVTERAGYPLQRVQCAGMSGFPLVHELEGRFPSGVELGMAAVVAERTGLTTVGDFGTRDLAAGGTGVPVTALADYLVVRHPSEARVLVDLGSVSRVVTIPAGGRLAEVLGYEAGPCGVLLDELMRRTTSGREEFDPGGKHAVQGHCVETLLRRWLDHPFLQRQPPRSLTRLAFGPDFVARAVQHSQAERIPLQDLLCTATHFVVRCVTDAVARPLSQYKGVSRVILAGGGTRNGLLWRLLEEQLAGVPLERSDSLGIPVDACHAFACGVLAGLTLDGVPSNLPSVTGAAGTRLLGSLTPGSPANWSRCLAWMSGQAAPGLADAA
jgi:anhydro-N-acetylmuramic acid kinase